MATYAELSGVINDPDLRTKVFTALVIKVDAITDEAAPLPTERHAYVEKAWNSMLGEANRVMFSVVANNKDVTIANLLAATDAQIQTQVDAVVETLITTDAGA